MHRILNRKNSPNREPEGALWIVAAVGKLRPQLLLVIAVLLSACASQRPQTPQAPSVPSSPVAQLQHWTIKGKLGVRSPGDNSSANLTWQQRAASDYRIHLSGPLGAGTTVISGTPAGISLQRGSEPPLQARNPEELTAQTLGWPLPVNEMFYWVRGLPAPGPADHQRRNPQGQLQYLQQSGWQLDFTEYQMRGPYMLPTRIKASTQSAAGPVTVKLVIKEWLF